LKIINKIVFLVFLSGVALSYQDLDIDGVDDSIDKCPNTPFDELVDEDGCSKTQKKVSTSSKYGNLTLKIGIDTYIDKDYEDDKTLSLYANYNLNNWDLSISNAHSTFNSSYNDSDIYFLLGYTFDLSTNFLKLSIGTKINSDNKDDFKKYKNKKEKRAYGNENNQNEANSNSSSRKNDYLTSIDYNYMLNDKLSLLLYYEYTLSGNSKRKDYKNFSSFSTGIGYSFNQDLYTSLSYSYIGSIYKEIEASKSIDLFSNYSLTKKLFITAGYSYALDNLSYDNCFSLAFGINF